MRHKWRILKTVAETPFTELGRGRICGEGPTTLSAGFVSRDRDYKLRTRKIFGSPANVTCTQHFGSIAKTYYFSVCSSKYYRRCASNYGLPVLHRSDCTTEIGKA